MAGSISLLFRFLLSSNSVLFRKEPRIDWREARANFSPDARKVLYRRFLIKINTLPNHDADARLNGALCLVVPQGSAIRRMAHPILERQQGEGILMSAEESRGVVLNTKTLSAIIAGLTLLGMFWTGSTWVNNQVHKTDLLDRRVTQIEESQKKDLELAGVRGERILTKVEALQKDVQALTNALTKVEAHRRGDLRQAASGEGTARGRRPPVRLIQSLSNGTMDDDTLNKRTLILRGIIPPRVVVDPE